MESTSSFTQWWKARAIYSPESSGGAPKRRTSGEGIRVRAWGALGDGCGCGGEGMRVSIRGMAVVQAARTTNVRLFPPLPFYTHCTSVHTELQPHQRCLHHEPCATTALRTSPLPHAQASLATLLRKRLECELSNRKRTAMGRQRKRTPTTRHCCSIQPKPTPRNTEYNTVLTAHMHIISLTPTTLQLYKKTNKQKRIAYQTQDESKKENWTC
jgi:hypothetical protein